MPDGSHSPSSSAPRRSSTRASLTNSWSRVRERARTSRFRMQSDGRWALIEDLLPRPALVAGWYLSAAGHACAGDRPAAASLLSIGGPDPHTVTDLDRDPRRPEY